MSFEINGTVLEQIIEKVEHRVPVRFSVFPA